MKRMVLKVTMTNGDEWEVQTVTGDFVAYDDTAKRQRPPWGSMSENIARWEAFLGWRASKRQGLYGKSWEEFLDDCANVDGEPVDLDPTQRGLGADTSQV